ncbi:MAG: cysteine desulfurase [Pseudomonadota bacterium]|nr:cysteine desulfurase [Pseudomonadota bacterium]
MSEVVSQKFANIISDFPILTKDISECRGRIIYLDNAATTQSSKAVIDAVDSYYKSSHSNIHSGLHYLSEMATVSYENARKTVADFIGAKKNEIIFSAGTTAAINTVAFGFAKHNIKPNSTILVSGMEHHANLIPWQVLAQELNLSLKIIPVKEDGTLDIEQYEEMLSEQVSFLAITHVSNVLGTINPIKEMVRAAKKYDIPVLVDGAQAISHTEVNVADLGCDFYAFSAHKIYGPTGTGALYIKDGLLPKFRPVIYGGGMIETVSYSEASFLVDDVARLEPGTPNISGVIGMAAALNYFSEIGKEHIFAHEQELLQYAEQELAKIPEVKIYGNAQHKVGVISFTLADIHAHDITSLLDEDKVAVRGGHHCAMPLVKSFGLSSLTRASLGIYNNEQDIDALCNSLQRILRIFKI